MNHVIHPAVLLLVRLQIQAKLRRLGRVFSNRRRTVLSLVACALAIIWLGNAVASILFREPIAAGEMQTWIPLALFAYTAWHVIKVAFRRSEDSIDWTPSEREWLCGGPFSRRDLISYHLCGISIAAVAKSFCFALLMLPDLQHFGAGLAGTLLSLLLIDLVRLTVEIMAFGLSERAYRRLQVATIAVLVVAAISVISVATATPLPASNGAIQSPLAFMQQGLQAAKHLSQTTLGSWILTPFYPFTTLMTASRFDLSILGSLLVCAACVGGMWWTVFRVDRFVHRAVVERERQLYGELTLSERTEANVAAESITLPPIPFFHGIGPLAWRQFLGARYYRSNLAVALALPGVLAALPLLVYDDNQIAALNVAGALVFYSFLLLPSALRFDFRRDIERMTTLKSLPVHPLAFATGQLAAPTLLCFGFQASVLLMTMALRPFPPGLLASMLLLLLPLDVLIFGIDNLLYLLYPYRLNQEGFEIFLRTTLTFTAKGLIFAGGLVIAAAGSFLANFVSRTCFGTPDFTATIFVVGMWVTLAVCTGTVVQSLASVFHRFDPSADVPA